MTVETSATSAEQTAALAALAIGDADVAPTVEPVQLTGRELYAGGDVRRILVAPAHLSWSENGALRYAPRPEVGDVVLVTRAQADRLDRLGATVEETADLEEVALEQVAGLASDAALEAMRAPELVAYVTQHPDERPRVRQLEQSRPSPRKTVLTATETTPEEDDAAEERRQQIAGAVEDEQAARAEFELEEARRQEAEALLVSGTRAEGDPVTDTPTATGFARLSPELDDAAPLNLP